MKKILSLILIPALFVALLSCAISTEYDLLNDESEIASVDIVETVYDDINQKHIEYPIINIEDVDEFIINLRKIKHTTSLIPVSPIGVEFSALVFKISYKNGEYEFFDDCSRSYYTNDRGFCFYGDDGSFDREEFYALMFDYICLLENQTFNYMRSKQDVMGIDIVKNESSKREVVKQIEDIHAFLDELENIDYMYVNQSFVDYENCDGSRAVRLTYSDGSEEFFTHDHREQHSTTNASYCSYIGTFNEAQFNALIEKYMQN